MTGKRKPGRPKGSFKKGDGKYLEAVADLMTRDTTLKKTPAIACVVEKNFPQHQWKTAERRLLRRWNETENDRIIAAQERRKHHNGPSDSKLARIGQLARLELAIRSNNNYDILFKPAFGCTNLPIFQHIRSLKLQETSLKIFGSEDNRRKIEAIRTAMATLEKKRIR